MDPGGVLGMDAGLLGFLVLGVTAVVAFLFQLTKMCSAIINPPSEDPAPVPPPNTAKAAPVAALPRLPRISSKEKRCSSATEALIADVEAGTMAQPAHASGVKKAKLQRSTSSIKIGRSKHAVEPMQPLMRSRGDECASP